VQNPLATQRALLALRAQAAQWLAEYDAALLARGFGFTPEDVAQVEKLPMKGSPASQSDQ